MSIEVLPDELVLEILVRLPGKQIGRCKCVSKPWRSLIRSRPFRQIYRRKNSGLLIYWPEEIRRRSDESEYSGDRRRLRFFHCPLRRRGEAVEDFSPLRELDLAKVADRMLDSRTTRVAELVEGLFCAFERDGNDGSNFSLTLHNICTGEKMKIPDPLTCDTFSMYDGYDSITGEKMKIPVDTFSMYHLGYDSEGKVYKLLRLISRPIEGWEWNGALRRYPKPWLQRAQIMTLRPPSGTPSTWRELSGLPSGVCMTGLFRARTCGDEALLCWIGWTQFLCFDLKEERFWLVELPLDVQSRDKNVFHLVTRIKDRLVLWVSSSECKENVISCYVQEDDEGKNWRIFKEFESASEDFAFAAGIVASSSSKGEILGMGMGMNLDDHGHVHSYSQEGEEEDDDVFFVGKLPDGAHAGDACGVTSPEEHCFSFKPTSVRLACFSEGNNLYLPLDDVLAGASV